MTGHHEKDIQSTRDSFDSMLRHECARASKEGL